MAEWIFSCVVLILAVCAVRMIVKGKIGLRVQYALWALVLLRLLMPVSFFQSDISVANLTHQAQVVEDTEEFSFPVPQPEEIQRPVQSPVTDEQDTPVQCPTVTRPSAQENTAKREPPKASASKREAKTEISLAEAAIYVWIGGMVVAGCFLVFTNIRFYLRLRRSRKELAIPFAPVRVFVSNAAVSPCLFGLVRPAIYLPTAVAEDYAALQHVYAHELTHYYHLDFIWSALRSVCLVIHWYNPLVWLAAKLSRQDMELACDEGALKRIGEEERADYGRTLIHLTCKERFGNMMIAATTMTGGKKEIKERITLLMKKPKTALITAVALLLIATVLVGCTFSGSVDTSNDEKETEKTTEKAEPEMIALTEQELNDLAQMFDLERTYNTKYRWFNMALTSQYACPQDVDLYNLFYNGFQDEVAGPEELEKLEKAGLWMDLDIQKNPSAKMDEVLKTYFGLSLEETNRVGLDYMVYLADTDSYYKCAGDVCYGDAAFTRGYHTDDGRIILYYQDFLDEEWVVTLVEDEKAELGLYVYSNMPVNPHPEEAVDEDEGTTALTAEAFFQQICLSIESTDRAIYNASYQDLVFESYYDPDYPGFQYQVWYRGEQILGPADLRGEGVEYRNNNFVNCYMLSYENSTAFMIIALEEVGADAYFDVQVFDTNGYVLFKETVVGAPEFDVETGNLFYSVYSDDEPMNHANFIAYFETDLDGNPLLSITANPNNADLSVYS